MELKHFDQGMVFWPALIKELRKFLLSPGLMALRLATPLLGLYSGGRNIGRIFASEIWGAYFREGLFWGGLIIGIFTASRKWQTLLTRQMCV